MLKTEQQQPRAEGFKRREEPRSQRLQLLIQPTLYKIIKEGADREGTSVNDYIHTILKNAHTSE